MTHIVGISGSLRRGSYNAALLRAAAAMAPDGTEIAIGSIAGIPLYDQDDQDRNGVPAAVVTLQDQLAAADGLLLVTPEYNNGIPGVTKNAIDWLSRPSSDIPRVFGDLPVGLAGVGGRGGTRLSQAAWLPVLRTLGARPWFGGSLYGGPAPTLFSETGELTDETVARLLERFVTGFCAYVADSPRRRAAADD